MNYRDSAGLGPIRYSTTVEAFADGRWEFFSQQSIKSNEVEMSDEEYLERCKEIAQGMPLRVAAAPAPF